MENLSDRSTKRKEMAGTVEITVHGHRLRLIKSEKEAEMSWNVSEDIDLADLAAACGSKDPDFFVELLNQLANVSSNNHVLDEHRFKFGLSMLRGLSPEDPLEAIIATKIVEVQSWITLFTNRLASAEHPVQMESLERSLNRLMRTFCSLVETYRDGRGPDIPIQRPSVANTERACISAVKQLKGFEEGDGARPVKETGTKQPSTGASNRYRPRITGSTERATQRSKRNGHSQP